MEQKDETIYIRLTSEMKEEFKKYCKIRKLSMTDVLTSHVSSLLLNAESIGNDSNINLLKKERDFFKLQLKKYRNAYVDIQKIVLASKNDYYRDVGSFYENLIIENFSKIDVFQNFELTDTTGKLSELIAVNKNNNEAIIIDFESDISKKTYKHNHLPLKLTTLRNQYDNFDKCTYVIITLDKLNEDSYEIIENILKVKTTYDIKAYWIEDLIDFD